MNHRRLLAGLTLLTLLTACSKNDSSTPSPTPATQGRYLIMSNDFNSQTGAGYLTTYPSLPTGTISNIAANSLQSQGTFGTLTYLNNWVFKSSNVANETGIQKFSIGVDGRLKDEGFIKSADNRYYIVSATEGYYWDSDLGRLKIQKFNPTTMQRTGEIDLTANLTKAGEAYISAGQHVIAAHNGKLFVSIYYGKSATSIGFLDYKYDTAYMAVVDVATGKYEKTIQMPNVSGGIGYLASNPMWTKAADGTMYFCCLGNVGAVSSKIIRIKAGTTDFDQTWSLNMDDYRKGSSFVNVYVKGNALYAHVSTEAIKADYSNLYNEIWEYYAIDLTTKQATKVGGINTPVLFTGDSHSIIEINNQLYFRVINSAQKLNGYYVLDGTTTKPAFNLSAGGNAQDFQFIPQ